jgi:hypothetical protein
LIKLVCPYACNYRNEGRNRRTALISYKGREEMSFYICRNCFKTSEEKLAKCPKCGATDSFVPPDEISPWSPIGPVSPYGSDTGGIMPDVYEQYLPKLPILPSESEKEAKKKRSEKD